MVGIPQEAQEALLSFSQVEKSTTTFEGTDWTGVGQTAGRDDEWRRRRRVNAGRRLGFFAEFETIELKDGAGAVSGEFAPKDWLLSTGDGETGLEAEPEELVAASTQGEKILIVDDLRDMRRFVGRALSDRGYRVFQAGNGEQGIEVARKHQPDLIITDWMMPKLSGPDMIQVLRREANTAHTPMILLTAKTDQDSKILGAERGLMYSWGSPLTRKSFIQSCAIS